MYTFITGNENKAREFSQMVGMDIPHLKIDVPEIQALELEEVIEEKAMAAYDVLRKPVIVEDVSLILYALGKLPGPFIKFFLKSMGNSGLIGIADKMNNRKAEAKVCYGLYDGQKMKIFSDFVMGDIAEKERGENGFAWDKVFIPSGFEKTFAEMSPEEKNKISMRNKPIADIREFLQNLE